MIKLRFRRYRKILLISAYEKRKHQDKVFQDSGCSALLVNFACSSIYERQITINYLGKAFSFFFLYGKCKGYFKMNPRIVSIPILILYIVAVAATMNKATQYKNASLSRMHLTAALLRSLEYASGWERGALGRMAKLAINISTLHIVFLFLSVNCNIQLHIRAR